MKIQKLELPHPHKPEVGDEHPRLEQAIKAVLAATVAAGIYHHYFKGGKGFSYIRPYLERSQRTGDKDYDLPKEIPSRYDFEIGIGDASGGIIGIFGKILPSEGGLSEIDKAKIIIEENYGVSPDKLEQILANEESS